MVVAEPALFIACTAVVFLVMAVGHPVFGARSHRRLLAGGPPVPGARLRWYRDEILWAWASAALVLVLVPLSGATFSNLGLRLPDFGASGLPAWAVYAVAGLAVLYGAYNLVCLHTLRRDPATRAAAARGLSPEVAAILPATRAEKRAWVLLSFTAGVTEELLYRGFLFAALPYLFPGLSLAAVLGIATALFGIGHVYQGWGALRPTLVGFVYGCLYIVFDSLLPVMLLHFLQDVVAAGLRDDADDAPDGGVTGVP